MTMMFLLQNVRLSIRPKAIYFPAITAACLHVLFSFIPRMYIARTRARTHYGATRYIHKEALSHESVTNVDYNSISVTIITLARAVTAEKEKLKARIVAVQARNISLFFSAPPPPPPPPIPLVFLSFHYGSEEPNVPPSYLHFPMSSGVSE